ncbi:hypothetical protein C2845_PM01G31100 [Panicum miliaceum]|uniref:F-box domain-containing protein n=1 Tax=Panicum miliaceum TaxID=4540 RepID=A0A3L6TQY1_PANMI|nr:hypothetical protein C2845_PM01G31100 [Panicum miliaceum]
MAPPRPCLPTDCLFHVFLRLDPVSIVRCAAVSRHWRRAVTDNASEIRRHPAGRADRCLLLGLHYREMYPGELGFSRRSSWLPPAGRHWSDGVPAPSRMPEPEGTEPKLYAPLACGDGLLCRGLPAEISVVNPFTGFHTTIARPGGLVPYRYVLHSCHGAQPNSFQNYSSDTGAWGPVLHPDADDLRVPWCAAPLVCQGAIHWLCSISNNGPDGDERYFTHTVAVDMTTGRARMTRLPKQCSMRNEDVADRKMLMLATSEDDRLSLLRREEEASLEVSVWLYVGDHDGGGNPENSWLLRQSTGIRKLIEDAGLSRFRLGCKGWEVLEIRLERFCPRSRSVILWIPYLGLLVLDPEGRRIQRAADDSHGHIWPYEIDLTLCVCSMKTF